MPEAKQENPNNFLYEKIYLALKKEILSGAFAKGAWFPPERALKDRFGTTHLTVRNALAKLVQEGYIERFSGKGTIVIYSRGDNTVPRPSLRFSRAHLLIAEPDAVGAALMLSLEEQLRRIELTLHISLHRGNPALERSLFGAAMESRALVLLQPVTSTGSLLDSGVELQNTILVGSGPSAPGCAQVGIDVAGGARIAIRQLIDQGHRVIAFLSQAGSEGESLREGWENELGSSGIEADPGLQSTCADSVETAALAAKAILSRRSDCSSFLCSSDQIAAGVAFALRESGKEIGRDASVIGYGNTPLAEALGLSSLDPRLGNLCELIMATVIDGIRRGRLPSDRHVIMPRLVGRGSSGGLHRERASARSSTSRP